MTKKVLITGIDSFTGRYLSSYLEKNGYTVFGTSIFHKDKRFKCDIRDKEQIIKVLNLVNPDYLIHLAAISFVDHSNNEDFYSINTIGSINVLDAFLEIGKLPKKIILASSATVYGNQQVEVLDESLCPNPINHYGASKYAMECLAKNFFEKLPIIITRPFNYTGNGQSEKFLIPKIVKHFKEKKKIIELGNLDVIREFNDINFVCKAYKELLESNKNSTIVNIASNRGIKLLNVIELMNTIAGYKIQVKVNPKYIRKNEIKKLTGSSEKLFDMVGKIEQCDFAQTLKKIYEK